MYILYTFFLVLNALLTLFYNVLEEDVYTNQRDLFTSFLVPFDECEDCW